MTVPQVVEQMPEAQPCRGTILFVDDDTRLIDHFAEAVGAAGFTTHHVRGPDQALSYLEQPDTTVDVIVWDMMLAPGATFCDDDTESGLSTGRLLYPRMRALQPDIHYILFTARGDVSFAEFDAPEHRSYVRHKTELSLEGLVEFITELLAKGE